MNLVPSKRNELYEAEIAGEVVSMGIQRVLQWDGSHSALQQCTVS